MLRNEDGTMIRSEHQFLKAKGLEKARVFKSLQNGSKEEVKEACDKWFKEHSSILPLCHRCSGCIVGTIMGE